MVRKDRAKPNTAAIMDTNASIGLVMNIIAVHSTSTHMPWKNTDTLRLRADPTVSESLLRRLITSPFSESSKNPMGRRDSLRLSAVRMSPATFWATSAMTKLRRNIALWENTYSSRTKSPNLVTASRSMSPVYSPSDIRSVISLM